MAAGFGATLPLPGVESKVKDLELCRQSNLAVFGERDIVVPRVEEGC